MAFSLSEEGDTIDLIVWRHYGRQDGGLVERVLEVNRHLAAAPAILPAGLRIELPEIEPDEVEPVVRLWS